MSPSCVLGLTPGSYEAYCLDEAVWYFGTTVQAEVDKAGQKKAKGQAATEAARKKILERFVGSEKKGSGFADPATFFDAK